MDLRGNGPLTDTERRLRVTAETLGARLLVIDNLAGVFAGN